MLRGIVGEVCARHGQLVRATKSYRGLGLVVQFRCDAVGRLKIAERTMDWLSDANSRDPRGFFVAEFR